MGKYTNNDHLVICPYFHSQALRSITCEGIKDGTDTLTRFPTPELKDYHVRNACNTWNYSVCPVAAILDGKNGAEAKSYTGTQKTAESGFAKSENGITGGGK